MVVSGCCSRMSCVLRTTKDNNRPQGREVVAPPYLRRTSNDSDGVSQASSTLRGYDVKQFYNVVTNFLHCQERSECINFSPDSITRIHAVPRFPLTLAPFLVDSP